MSDLRVFRTLKDASHMLAAEIARQLSDAKDARGCATISLSGGGTPQRLHETLADEYTDLPWTKIHVFLGDERFVPPDSEDSNYRMARETLLDDSAIPPGNIHPWQTAMDDPEAAALAMQVEMERLFDRNVRDGGPPRFDVMLLGIGDDGHTASLFPRSPALRVSDRWVVQSEAPDPPRQRLTMTLPVLNASRHIHFLVSGESKREALRCALRGDGNPDCPASMIQPTDGTLTWWLDEEVAP